MKQNNHKYIILLDAMKKIPVVPGIMIGLVYNILAWYWSGSVDTVWYSNLVKPSYQPPNWLFAPVWIILYLFLGIITAIDLNEKGEKATFLLGISMIANLSWSYIFFTLNNQMLALIVILIVNLSFILYILMVNKLNYKLKKTITYLGLPYIAWLIFATDLNLNIVLLN